MDRLTLILNEALNSLQSSNTIDELEKIKVKYIGKNGLITNLMHEIKSLAPEERKDFGVKVNFIKKKFEEALSQKKEEVKQKELNFKTNNETIDVSLDGRGFKLGALHPITISENRMQKIFSQLGFKVADGPEIETDYYNFKALNIPDNHPARAMQDTFYTMKLNVLRTHTSPVQIRYAENNTPPIKIIVPGRVFRVDMDATHSPMFHQLEGLWIDKGISFADLKGTIINFLRIFFGNNNLVIRFRNSFFPFTEPSAEVDIMSEDGKWLEVLGCGMVHPNVLNNMNIDPNIYSGFAFGIGIDRFTMLKYKIHDLRLLFENDIDFLQQFQGIS